MITVASRIHLHGQVYTETYTGPVPVGHVDFRKSDGKRDFRPVGRVISHHAGVTVVVYVVSLR